MKSVKWPLNRINQSIIKSSLKLRVASIGNYNKLHFNSLLLKFSKSQCQPGAEVVLARSIILNVSAVNAQH